MAISREMDLSGVDDDVYTPRVATTMADSIGEHVDHCLDHVSALLAADSSLMLSYDRRQRGTAIETDPRSPSTPRRH